MEIVGLSWALKDGLKFKGRNGEECCLGKERDSCEDSETIDFHLTVRTLVPC